MLYHPGKVYRIISSKDEDVMGSDSSVQATLEMWDGNIFTFSVEKGVVEDMKKGDIALVDYSPREGSKVPVPNHNIVKVMRGKDAEELWRKYKKFHEKRRKKSSTNPSFQPSYMG